MDLGEGTVAVVTGAGSGIGLALAEAFASAGCSLVLADVQVDALAAAEQRITERGVPVLARRTDVSKVADVEALAAATIERFGVANIVCNNAGVAAKGDPWIGPIESWEWTMGVNFWGVVHGVRAFLPHLVLSGQPGHIVNTASIAGIMPGMTPSYDASKHAVVAITEDLYNTLQTAGLPVGVSCLCPGWVRTGILDADRNWPSDLGAPPVSDAGAQVTGDYVRRAIDEGMQPGIVADLVLDAVRSGQFWIFPHHDFLEIAVDRYHRIAESLDPVMPSQMPGLPPRDVIVAEVMAATLGGNDGVSPS